MDKAKFQDKVNGCWIGKCLGGAIGMPYEGVPYLPALREEDIELQDVPNDDLELQLVWMLAMEKHGAALSAADLAPWWTEHIIHGCDEYSIAIRNLRRGVMPPVSGAADNFFADGMGAAIRSEIWALICAGRPDAAAHFAACDAVVDHWGDGVRAEVFMATAECLALELSDIREILSRALESIPPEGRLRSTLSEILEMHRQGIGQEEAKNIICRRFYHHNFTDCVMNLGFIVYALLWGKGDFVQTILLAVNCGRDTDCTAASCGAFLGILNGTRGIPTELQARLSPILTLSKFIAAIPGVPRSLPELLERTLSLQSSLSGQLSSSPYPPYQPCPVPAPAHDRAEWLIIDEAEHDIEAVKETLLREGCCPAELRKHVKENFGLSVDLSPLASKANTLNLFSFLEVEHDATPAGEVVMSVTADVGMTLWLDNDRLMNHHARLLSIPSFHRAEGGAAFNLRLERGMRKLVHIKLYSCLPPLKCTMMFGNKYNDHLDGFNMLMP